ncbi:MAG TPA: hypothetical protein VFM18_24450, partial [Methanosarcina sp.]|nr:hypothetical protein [Methanosarcina sp.]
LNVTASFLGKEGITLTPQGDVTHIIPTLTGLVTSPEPYQIMEVTIHLVRSMSLADRFKKQIENLSTLGNSVARSDATTMSDYPLTNTSIKSVDAIKMNGEDAGWMIHLQGVYIINQSLYNV